MVRYCVMESHENKSLPVAPKNENEEVVIVPDLKNFDAIDYDYRSGLISDRFKTLAGSFLLRYNFEFVVYLNSDRTEHSVFWKFSPPVYTDYQATYRNDGIVSHITFTNNLAPMVFTTKSPKGVRSIVVCIAIVESALRRGITGLKFTKVTEG